MAIKKPAKRKYIKILSKGFVLTSRGMARTPIAVPYMEYCDVISQMITRYNAKVVEVLADGSEVELTFANFAEPAAEEMTVTQAVPVTVEVKNPTKVVEEVVAAEPVREDDVPAPAAEKHLTRKERRELERRRRAEAKKEEAVAAPVEVVVPVEETAPVATPEDIIEMSQVSEDAIEE